MRKLQFAIFFSVFFSLYGLINWYIFYHGWDALPESSPVRALYLSLYLFFSLSFIAGRFLERATLSWPSSVLVWIGSYWLAAMLYLSIAVYLIDCLRLVHHVVPYLPSFLFTQEGKEVAGAAVACGVGIVVATGHFNARRPRIKSLELVVRKNSRSLRQVRIVVASDIHLGTIVCKSRLESIVSTINSLDPDLVLLPGDVVDEDLGPVMRQNLGETLKTIRSRFGVLAVTGNHEFIGGAEEACRYLTDHGIRMVRDEAVLVAESFYIVGREDISVRQFAGRKRKELHEILGKNVDPSLPMILMDHQPFRLEEASQQGVDIQLSGHTHHGQLWPLQMITRRMYEVSWGYKKKENTHIYVSSGVGTWGPPVRIGNTPEIVHITLHFQNDGYTRSAD